VQIFGVSPGSLSILHVLLGSDSTARAPCLIGHELFSYLSAVQTKWCSGRLFLPPIPSWPFSFPTLRFLPTLCFSPFVIRFLSNSSLTPLLYAGADLTPCLVFGTLNPILYSFSATFHTFGTNNSVNLSLLVAVLGISYDSFFPSLHAFGFLLWPPRAGTY